MLLPIQTSSLVEEEILHQANLIAEQLPEDSEFYGEMSNGPEGSVTFASSSNEASTISVTIPTHATRESTIEESANHLKNISENFAHLDMKKKDFAQQELEKKLSNNVELAKFLKEKKMSVLFDFDLTLTDQHSGMPDRNGNLPSAQRITIRSEMKDLISNLNAKDVPWAIATFCTAICGRDEGFIREVLRKDGIEVPTILTIPKYVKPSDLEWIEALDSLCSKCSYYGINLDQRTNVVDGRGDHFVDHGLHKNSLILQFCLDRKISRSSVLLIDDDKKHCKWAARFGAYGAQLLKDGRLELELQ